MELQKIDGLTLRQMLWSGGRLLEENKAAVNALNVFPVPDGDTGTNMCLTMAQAIKETEKLSVLSVSKVCEAASAGSLMGARGNSGVILSQLLRGFAKEVEGKETLNAREFAVALQAAVSTAYQAVIKPVEGTILTVAREAAKAAGEAARRGVDVVGVLDAAITKGEQTLNRTPEMLPVLKRAGVVDAGGQGLMLILKGAKQALLGEDARLPVVKDIAPKLVEAPIPTKPVTEEMAFQYCTEVIIKGQQLPLEKMQVDLSRFGDSLLVVGTSEMIKVHVHTNHPGQVLEYCLSRGTLHQVKVDNMQEQHREFLNDQMVPLKSAGTAERQKLIGLVAVAVGDGLIELLRSLGVDQIVEGGQTMNPSTEEIVSAVNQVTADKVIVLPNNNNIVLAAEQARSLVNKEVVIVPTKSILQGIAALIAFDPEAELDDNYRMMLDSIKQIKSGEITYAVRDCQIGDLVINTGDILGMVDGEIAVVDGDVSEAARTLISKMVDESSEMITIYYGQNVLLEDAQELKRTVQADFPDCEVELHYGGQPLYYYLISAE
ncbi:MAG: DAK2 domain-containing protein [Firmicutes bacterium]|nr:DAK2 domain-containing protein [Bacillota bacterium]